MKTRIIVDSSCDVNAAIKSRLHIVPLSIHFGDTEYIDGVDIDHQKFYEMLVESDELPHTSQPSPDAFAKAYAEAAEAGEACVVLTIASKLSGTYQSATIAAEDFENVYIVDSQTAAIGAGILAELALQLADSGMEAKDIAARLEQERENVHLVALVDTLEYLKRGGRVSKTVAFAGTLLNIKPVLAVRDGEILMLGKARGSKQGNNLLVQEIEKAGGVDFAKPVLLGYTGLSDALLKKYIEDSHLIWKGNLDTLRYTTIGSTIGTHVGPGAIAVAFFKK